MPAQKTISSLAKRLGEQLADAESQTKGQEVDRGVVQVPGGINNGVFQLTTGYISEIDKGDDKGKPYFRASGVIKTPDDVNGVPCKGLHTSLMVRLWPQKPYKKSDGTMADATTFAQQWAEYKNFFLLFKVDEPPGQQPNETKLAMAHRVEAYYQNALKLLLQQKPHCTFSTREWTAKATPANPKPKTRVFETWHGVCDYNDAASMDPSLNGVVDHSADTVLNPPPGNEPGNDAVDVDQPQQHEEPAAAMSGDVSTAAVDESTAGVDLEELARVADADMAGKTEDGKAAIAKITELAMAAGATKEQIDAADNWTVAAAMCVPQEPTAAAEPTPPTDPVKGTHRTYKGVEYEVLTVNAKNSTVTLRNVKTKTDLKMPDKKTFVAIKWADLDA